MSKQLMHPHKSSYLPSGGETHGSTTLPTLHTFLEALTRALQPPLHSVNEGFRCGPASSQYFLVLRVTFWGPVTPASLSFLFSRFAPQCLCRAAPLGMWLSRDWKCDCTQFSLLKLLTHVYTSRAYVLLYRSWHAKPACPGSKQ